MKLQLLLTKILFHLIALMPLIWLIYAINFDQLSADPAKDIQHFLGVTTLRLLVVIAIIPSVAIILQWNSLFQVRKLLGLWSFCWASLHLTSYLLLEIGWGNFAAFFNEIFSRVYLTVGFIGWVILFLMAFSSFAWFRLNFAIWWNRIQALFYPLLLLVILHYILSLKTITPEPFFYLGIIIFSYGFRWVNIKKRIK